MEKEDGEGVELNASPRLVILVCRGLIALENRLQMPNLETMVKTAIQDQVRIKKKETLRLSRVFLQGIKNLEWERGKTQFSNHFRFSRWMDKQQIYFFLSRRKVIVFA